MDMPPLTTDRLLIRPLVAQDLDAVQEVYGDSPGGTGRAERERWLLWTTLGYGELARLQQPPYGDRGIVLRETGRLIGLCGFVPCLDAFAQLPAFGAAAAPSPASTEFGLYWAIAPSDRRRGYATEASRALIDYAFRRLRLQRIIATTTADNLASIAVMRRLGMRIERNPHPVPPWLQVVGVLTHPGGLNALQP